MSERKAALVIHGMSELGSAICQRLYRDGFHVTALYSPQQRTPEAWLAAQRDEGFSFSALCGDIGGGDACAALRDKLLAGGGRVDVLVNLTMLPDVSCVGLHEVTAARWQSVRAMLDGVFNVTRQLLPAMQARQWGRIIQVAPPLSWCAPDGGPAVDHGAASTALQGLTRALALEVARQGVTVNTIVPGCLACDVADRALSSALPNALSSVLPNALSSVHRSVLVGARTDAPSIPVGRLGTAQDVAALAAYLASDGAGFVTGAQIAINGGQHMM